VHEKILCLHLRVSDFGKAIFANLVLLSERGLAEVILIPARRLFLE
jgi:hypothetical protein